MIVLTVIGTSSELDVRRGAITQHNGKVEMVNEFVLIKIDTGLIKENEDNLVELRTALASIGEKIQDVQMQKTILELKSSIDDELQETTPQNITTQKL